MSDDTAIDDTVIGDTVIGDTVILAREDSAHLSGALAAALGQVELRLAPQLSSLCAKLASEGDAPARAVIVIESSDAEPGLSSLDAQAVWDHVAGPLEAVARLSRELLSCWMEDGSAGLLAFVLVHRSGRSATPAMLEDALTSLTRSLAKEHGRRGTRTLLLVADPDQAADAASVLRLFLSPSAGLITGECMRLQRRGA